jgi:GAF domain-containing protein
MHRATNIVFRHSKLFSLFNKTRFFLITDYAHGYNAKTGVICTPIMAEDLQITEGSKQQQYETLLPQISAIIKGEKNLVANLANIAGALKEQFGWWWVGFYLVDSEDELVLGPFQGPVACTRIRKGKGVCGSAWAAEKTIIVPDVEQFPGHIACSSLSRSEIVVPVIKGEKVVGVLDVDSEFLDHFDETDKQYLEKLIGSIDWYPQ